MEMSNETLPTREQPSFSQFTHFPEGIPQRVWKKAMPGTRYVFQSPTTQILEAPPALAHTRWASREAEVDTGKAYQLENGRRTWFQPRTDVFIWNGSQPCMGELADDVRAIVIPCAMLRSYTRACQTFELLLGNEELRRIETIFVEMNDSFTIFDHPWNQIVGPWLFGRDTIVVPNLLISDRTTARVDSVSSILPNDIAERWGQNRQLAFTDDNVWYNDYAGDIIHAWVSTKGSLNPEIGDDQLDDFEAGRLMHPTTERVVDAAMVGGDWESQRSQRFQAVGSETDEDDTAVSEIDDH
ncbi:hypothetical protein AAE478_000247 [Parahypoxylon ruwenzoriense]